MRLGARPRGRPAFASKEPSAEQIANKVLRLDPRKPSDIDLFTSKFKDGLAQGFYPKGRAMHPASGPQMTEAQARSKLTAYLKAQFHNNSAELNAALALFDSPKTKAMVPSPTLRAAFVGMKGILLEPTMDYFLNSGRFAPVDYLPSSGDYVAVTTGVDPRFIFFNGKYASEDFRLLIGVFGHEVLHPTPRRHPQRRRSTTRSPT